MSNSDRNRTTAHDKSWLQDNAYAVTDANDYKRNDYLVCDQPRVQAAKMEHKDFELNNPIAQPADPNYKFENNMYQPVKDDVQHKPLPRIMPGTSQIMSSMKNQMTASEFLEKYGDLDDMKKMNVLKETNITDLIDFSEEISRSFITHQ